MITEFDNWFKKYEEKLKIGGRDQTIKAALESLLAVTTNRVLVETGCVRLADDWGAGMSTLIFADFCKQFGGHLYSVDINPEALKMAAAIIADAGIPPELVSLVENDSVEFLKNFDQRIDFLYLDSLDVPEYDSPESLALLKSQSHQLREAVAAIDKLTATPTILLDDNGFANGGKTRFCKLFLATKGFSEILDGKQSLWTNQPF